MSDGHNRKAALAGYIDRLENINEEISALGEDRKELLKGAKGEGFDVPMIKEMVRLRAMDKDKREERETLRDRYIDALDLI